MYKVAQSKKGETYPTLGDRVLEFPFGDYQTLGVYKHAKLGQQKPRKEVCS